MTTPADRVIAHNAGRHRREADPLCSLCFTGEEAMEPVESRDSRDIAKED